MIRKILRLLVSSLDQVKSKVDSSGRGVMFDCYRTSRFSRAGVVTYHGCFVDTSAGAINIHTGVFKVREEGVYQMTFTAKYVSSSKGMFGAWSDLYVNNTVSVITRSQFRFQM